MMSSWMGVMIRFREAALIEFTYTSANLNTTSRVPAHAFAYLAFSEQGHDYARAETWQTFWAAEAFLHEHLHGTTEPFPSDWLSGRVEIGSGAAQIKAWQAGEHSGPTRS